MSEGGLSSRIPWNARPCAARISRRPEKRRESPEDDSRWCAALSRSAYLPPGPVLAAIIVPNTPSLKSSVGLLAGAGPAVKNSWLRAPLAAAPCPNCSAHNPGAANGLPALKASVPVNAPVSGSKAWIIPSFTFPTRSMLLSGPKPAVPMPCPKARSAPLSGKRDWSQLSRYIPPRGRASGQTGYSRRQAGVGKLVVRSQASRIPP